MTTEQMTKHYGDRIVTHPDLLAGKPTIKGTRISVELVLKRLAQNPDLAVLFEAYPHLTVEDVKACLDYAHSLVEGAGRPTQRQPDQPETAAHPVV
jgi:uncharacterized protein (DUF433 family)